MAGMINRENRGRYTQKLDRQVALKWLKVKQARYREGERGWKPKS
jgi:hypothetical protein